MERVTRVTGGSRTNVHIVHSAGVLNCRHTMASRLKIWGACSPGLERVLQREWQMLGVPKPRAFDSLGGVEAFGARSAALWSCVATLTAGPWRSSGAAALEAGALLPRGKRD